MEIVKKEPRKDCPSGGKQSYEPPKAGLVPLKLEERLLSCFKLMGSPPCYGGYNS